LLACADDTLVIRNYWEQQLQGLQTKLHLGPDLTDQRNDPPATVVDDGSFSVTDTVQTWAVRQPLPQSILLIDRHQRRSFAE
jgi:hypothetical protein